jgi:photosystem II stability/assembly factor-like uncharacterized protein
MKERAHFLTACAVLTMVVYAGALAARKSLLTVEAIDYSQRTIYHSPEKVGYTSWVGLWRLPDGRLQCSFEQRTAAPGGAAMAYVSTYPVLESGDEGQTWTRVAGDTPSGGGRGMAVLQDGTLVRPKWGDPKDPSSTGYVQRSRDGGKSWGRPIYFLSAAKYQNWPSLIHRLRDGRLVMMAGVWKRGDGNPGIRVTKMMFVSNDQGGTWSAPIVLMPTDQGVCEESDFCELPNGDLFWVHRVEHYTPAPPVPLPPGAVPIIPSPDNNYPAPEYSDRYQSIVFRRGDGWEPGPATPAPFHHSGFPCVLFTKEGLILHFATDGIYWTADTGKTWTRLPIPGTVYYPQAVQLKSGKIICIGHVGGDNVYGTVNQTIVEQSFRLEVKSNNQVIPKLETVNTSP